MKALALFACLLGFSAVTAASSYSCQEDGQQMWATGQIRISSYGKLLHEYRCPQGHTAWMAQQ